LRSSFIFPSRIIKLQRVELLKCLVCSNCLNWTGLLQRKLDFYKENWIFTTWIELYKNDCLFDRWWKNVYAKVQFVNFITTLSCWNVVSLIINEVALLSLCKPQLFQVPRVMFTTDFDIKNKFQNTTLALNQQILEINNQFYV